MIKIIKHISILLALFIAYPGISLQAEKGLGIEKTIVKEATIDSSTLIKFDNSFGPVNVTTWDKDRVRIETFVTIDGEQEAIDKILEAIDNIDFTKSGSSISFDTGFYKQYRQTGKERITVYLSKLDKVKLTKLSISYTLMVPRNNPIHIKNSYQDLTLPDLGGKFILDLYEGDVVAGRLSKKAIIDIKYGGGSIESLNDTELSLYEAELEIGRAGDIDLDSRYSSFEAQQTGDLTLDSYEDDITVLKHGDVAAKSKYSTVKLADFGTGSFDFYEGSLSAGNGNDATIKALYTEVEFNDVQSLEFTELYEGSLQVGKVGSLRGKSNYTEIRIKYLEDEAFFLECYEGKVDIDRINRDFSRVVFNSKYTDITATIDQGAIYKVTADLTYTEIDIPAIKTVIKSGETSDHRNFSGTVNGSESNAKGKIELKMYEGKVVLR